MGDEALSDFSKFEYEMLQKEITRNAKIADTLKSIMIPVSLAMIGWAIGKSLSWWELTAISIASVGMLFLLWGACVRFHTVNKVFFSMQKDIENKTEKELNYAMSFRRCFKERLEKTPFCERLISVNSMLLIFVIIYALAWLILIIMTLL